MIPISSSLTALLLGLLLGYRWGRQDGERATPTPTGSWIDGGIRVGDRWSLRIEEDGSTTPLTKNGEPLDREAEERGLW